MKNIMSDDNKFEILKIAYQSHRQEIAYWREHSWQTTKWMIGLFMLVSAATLFLKAKYDVILVPLFTLSILATVYQHKNYEVYKNRWQRLADIEEALGFYEKDHYIGGKTLYPEELRIPKVTYKGTGFFIAAIWAMSISTAIAIMLQ